MKELALVGKIGTSQHFENKGRKAMQADVAEYTPAEDYQLKLQGARIGTTLSHGPHALRTTCCRSWLSYLALCSRLACPAARRMQCIVS